MTIQTPVYVSTSPDDGQGDKLRDAFIKINERFQDIASLMQNRGNWTTGTQYEPRDYILEGGEAYVCVIGHTAGTFATDLAAGKWASVDALDLRADLASTTIGKGAALVGFKQAGTGSVDRTAQDKMRETVSVKDFGAVGNGVADDTTSFSNAFSTGKRVYAPAGTYLLNFLNVPSNTFLYGDGDNTIIKPLTIDTRCALGADSGSSSAYIENVTIQNVKFLGDVAGSGFNEQKHLTSFNGVKNMLIDRCSFVGFRGDGVYIGSGNTGGQERHNFNVTVQNCFFDGVNNDNRNGISVIDGDGILIDNNSFYRCTRPNMPGAIDVEPDVFAFHVIKNITISNNYFDTVRNGITMTNMDNPTEQYFGFTIQNNYIKNAMNEGIAVTFSFNASPLTQTSKSMAIQIVGNRVEDSGIPLTIAALKGVNISQNTFVDCTASCVLGNGSVARLASFDVSFVQNTVERCGSAGTSWVSGIKCDGITNLTIQDNIFTDCGDNVLNSGCGVLFAPSSPSAVSNVNFRGNTFIKPALTNMAAVRLITSTISFSYDFVHDNNFNGLASIFLADSGTWTPTITFTTPGNLSVAYAERVGIWRRNGKILQALYSIITSTFTYTTASGACVVSGLPVANDAVMDYSPVSLFGGITKAGYTSYALQTRPSETNAWLFASGSGVSSATVTTLDIASASTVGLNGSITYQV
jgi:hypothetical protein